MSAVIYLDANGAHIGFEDVLTNLERARAHCAAAGLDAALIGRLIR